MTFTALSRTVRTQYLPALRQQTRTLTPLVYPAYEYSCDKAEAFHKSTAKIRALFGGNRASKSETGGYETVRLTRAYPGELFWVCGSTQDKLKICHKKIMKYLSPNEIQFISWTNSALGIPNLLRKTDGTTIEYKTYKSGIEAFAGESCKGVWMDEDPAISRISGEEIFVEALQRTVDCGGFLYITATPILGKNWMWKRIRQPSFESPNIDTWQVSLLENKFIAQDEKDLIKSLMTADEIDRRFYGLFTTLSGAVFKEFFADRHVIEPFPIPADWSHSIGIDLGYNNPFACVFAACAPDGTTYIYEGYKTNETLLADHYAKITTIADDFSLYGEPGKDAPFYRWESAICDHDAQERAELEALGMITLPANKDVNLSIAIINRLFKQDKLFIFNTMPDLIDELQTLIYKPISDRSDEKETILKRNDHLIDAMRYVIMYYHADSDFALGSTEVISKSAVF